MPIYDVGDHPSSTNIDTATRYWWMHEDQQQTADSVAGIIRAIDDEQQYRREANLRNLRMYSNLSILGLTGKDYIGDDTLPNNRLSLNVVESVIEAGKALKL
jgi:hypothetical protein